LRATIVDGIGGATEVKEFFAVRTSHADEFLLNVSGSDHQEEVRTSHLLLLDNRTDHAGAKTTSRAVHDEIWRRRRLWEIWWLC